MLHVQILTPEKKVYSGDAVSVLVPGTAGQFEMLNNHAPIVSSLIQGKVRINTGKEKIIFNVKSGFVECLNNEVTVLVEGITQ